MNKTSKLTEAEIVDRIRNNGEKPLFEIIVRRFNSYLYKTGRSYNFNHEDTQDLMQDTYVDAFRSLSKFDHRSSFKTWIIRIMLNNCYHKKQKLSFNNEFAQAEINENVNPMFNNSNNDANKHIHNRELKQIIEDSLGKIPEDYRMVFSLREMNGLNVSETADLLDISESNVKVRLNRAKAMLRIEIERSYAAEDIYEFNLIYCDALTEKVMKRIVLNCDLCD